MAKSEEAAGLPVESLVCLSGTLSDKSQTLLLKTVNETAENCALPFRIFLPGFSMPDLEQLRNRVK